MTMNRNYNYAQIDPSTGMCIGVFSGTAELTDMYYIEIPVNDPEHICKYYINGAWYEDPAGTITWISSLI